MILGIGCDIVEIKRVDLKIANKILTEKELAVYKTFQGHRAQEYLASRFCAKEAIFKALPVNNILISQIEILNDENHKLYCNIEGYKISISIAHEKDYAISYAICED